MATQSSTDEPVRPRVDLDYVKKIVLDLYGLKVVDIVELNGYYDKNYHVLVDCSAKDNNYICKVLTDGYTLKIVNTLESQDKEGFKAQNELLAFLNKNNIKCPQPILTKDKKPFDTVTLSSGNHLVKLLEFIPGDIMFKLKNPDEEIYYQVGSLVAQMDNVLENFDQLAFHKNVQWCLGAAPDILACIEAIDVQKQLLVKETIYAFQSRVLAVEDGLAKGIIHGDINEQNLIIETLNDKPFVKAVIDFGDTHYCCYLYELALAITYMIFLSNNIDSGAHVIAGYSAQRHIKKEEFKLLKICVMARFCQSLVLGAYANLKDPGNDYVLTTAERGWALLEKLAKEPEGELLRRWSGIG